MQWSEQKAFVGKETPTTSEHSDIYSIGTSIYYMALRKIPERDYSTNPIAFFSATGLSKPLASIVTMGFSGTALQTDEIFTEVGRELFN